MVKELFPGEEREQFAAIMQRIVDAEPIDAYESRRLTKDDRTLDVWVTLTTLVGEEGNVVSIASTERDITQRKQTEAQLKALNRELQCKEQEFRLLADNVPACFSYIDAGQRYRYVNRRYVELFARPAQDMIGKTVEEVLGSRFYKRALPLRLFCPGGDWCEHPVPVPITTLRPISGPRVSVTTVCCPSWWCLS